MYHPNNLISAFGLAKIQEEKLSLSKKYTPRTFNQHHIELTSHKLNPTEPMSEN